jgi:hypothetical protein
MNKTIIILLSAACAAFAGSFINFSGIHDSLDSKVKDYLEKNNYEKVTIYFDNKAQKDGKWLIFPFVKLSDSTFVVNVGKIPGVENKYSFSLLILKSSSISVLDTLGPFYDSYPGKIKFNNNKGGITVLILRVINPPEPNEEPFTDFKYIRINGKFKQIKK